MSSRERPIGAAKGTQSDTEALCQPPAPPPPREMFTFASWVIDWGEGGIPSRIALIRRGRK